jgi:hypothetical protein
MLELDPDAVAIALDHRIHGKPTAGRLRARGVAAAIRILALLHVVLVTTGAMDSSWAMAKSLAMSHTPINNEEELYQPAGPDAPAPDLALYDPADRPPLAFGHHAEMSTRTIRSASIRASTGLPVEVQIAQRFES